MEVSEHKITAFRNLMKSIHNFSNSRKKEYSPAQLLKEAGKVLISYPDAIYSSSFLLNPNTFEFDFCSSVPDSYMSKAALDMEQINMNGILGEVLSEGKIKYFDNKQSETGAYLTLIPLIGSEGLIALLVLSLEKFEEEPEVLSDLIFNFSEICSTSLENAILRNKLHISKTISQQEIANRTLYLVKSKKKLTDKFENLTSNLTMSMPHEVRTPLNMILGNIGFLQNNFNQLDPEDITDILNDLYISSSRLHSMLEKFILYANLSIQVNNPIEIERSRNSVLPNPGDMLESIAYNKSQQYDRQNDLKLSVIDEAIGISGELYSAMIEELIDNAFKFSSKNKQVEVLSFVEDSLYKITIKDSGIGMSSDEIDGIFAYNQFERVQNEQQGSGLGLAITSKIAQIYGGKFRVESKQHKYTAIFIDLPVVDIDSI